MAEEGSLLFQVETNEDSEDEDEVIRKQELQKLLEEELPDDLLETSEEEEDLTFHSSNEHLGNVHPSQHQFSSSVNNQMTFTSFHPRMNSHTLSNRNDIFHPVVNNEIVETLQSNYSPVSIQPNSLPPDHITYQQQNRNGLSDVYKGRNQSLPQDYITYPQQDRNGLSDVFKGTSQEYSTVMENTHLITSNSKDMQQSESLCEPVHINELSHLDKHQLEILYTGKTRQVKELESEMNRILKEEERKLGIFRHQVRILEEEKECLAREKDQFNDQCNVLTERVREYEEQEQVMKEKERDREELIEKLSAAQATISLLTKQINEISSTDSIQRIRNSYESALSTTTDQYNTELNDMRMKLKTLQEELVLKDLELENIKEKTPNKQNVNPFHKMLSDDEEKDNDEERRGMVAEIEDLKFQLITLQEQLTTSQHKVLTLEQTLHFDHESSDRTLREKDEELNNLKQATMKLENELSTLQTVAESNLKNSLEQCRAACLKLHEESSAKLREECLIDKNKIEQHYRIEMNRLRQEIGSLQSKLSTTRQQYIEISQMKEQYQEEIKHLNTNVTKLQNKLEQTNNTQLLTLKEEKGIQVTMETEREGDVHVHHKEMCSDRDRWEKEREVLLQQQVETALSAAHRIWKDNEETRVRNHVQVLFKRVTKEQQKKMADILKNEQVEWIKKFRHVEQERDREIQERDKELSLMRERMSQDHSVVNYGKLIDELKTILDSFKLAVIELMSTTLMNFRDEKNRELNAAMQQTIKNAETYYLSCLHELVNGKTLQ